MSESTQPIEAKVLTVSDGVVAGTCSINGDLFGEDKSRAVLVHYDYTVLAGTQGGQNHRKKDRLFELAENLELPVVFFTEGGGGRPGRGPGPRRRLTRCLAPNPVVPSVGDRKVAEAPPNRERAPMSEPIRAALEPEMEEPALWGRLAP